MMKILTLNTWQKRGPWRERWEVIDEGLQKFSPDVAAFQELFDPAWAEDIAARNAYPNVVHFPESSGLVLMSRFPVIEKAVKTLRKCSPTEDYDRYCLYAKVKTPSGSADFFVTHLSYRQTESLVRQKQAAEVLEWISERSSDVPCFLMGDFNAVSGTPEIERIIEAGFHDLWAVCHPGEQGLTWSHANSFTLTPENLVEGVPLPERRIDYIFTRSSHTGKVKNIQIVYDKPDDRQIWASDHFGLFTELE